MTPGVLTLRMPRALVRALEAEAVRRRMRVERYIREALEVRVAEIRTHRRAERPEPAPRP